MSKFVSDIIDKPGLIYVKDTDTPLPKHVKNTDMRYTHFKVIAKGGSSIIQSCLDNYLGRVVCHKTLRKEFRQDKYEQQRFLREARITAMLQHPNTIPVYDINRDGQNNMFFTMKLIQGRTLEEILTKLNQDHDATCSEFTLLRLLGVFIQVANALSFAHSFGVVHRDIKPANIAIGPFGEVWLLDWGIAKIGNEATATSAIKASDDAFDLTAHSSLKATPLYMSPEQGDQHRNIDHRSDIYSLGSVLYEILCLHKMAWGSSLDEIMTHTRRDTAVSPSRQAPLRDIPKAIENIYSRCVQKQVQDRYQNVQDLVDDVRQFREQGYSTSAGG